MAIDVNMSSGLAGITTSFLSLPILSELLPRGQNVFNLGGYIAQKPSSIYVILHFYLETIKLPGFQKFFLEIQVKVYFF